MTGYTCEIKEVSKELTKRERIKIKDTTKANPLDAVIDTGELITITPDAYAILSVNDGKHEEYEKFVVLDKNGEMYTTGSEPFFSAFKAIWDELEGNDDENDIWSIEVYPQASKNYPDKSFITCSLV